MFYSAALTAEQTDAIYIAGQGVTNCSVGRWLTDGSPSSGGRLIFTHIPQGMPFGLLVHDMVERFLLYFFHQSAHANTRGTFVTPESTKLDRNGGGYAFASAGLGNVPMGLKWMLCFEEPETRTLWLAKAIPRDWLAVGEEPLVTSRLATRYGRVGYTLVATSSSGTQQDSGGYTVHANITLPSSFGTNLPAGGIRLRIRAPLEHAGKLSKVTVGGKSWEAISAAEETVDFSAKALSDPTLTSTGFANIVATFGAAESVPLRPARRDPSKRIVPLAPLVPRQHHTTSGPLTASSSPGGPSASETPSCPDGTTLLSAFEARATTWVACEDLQRPDGEIVLVPAIGDPAHFPKSYAPWNTNWTDDADYYLGMGREAVANATTDILGAKLLGGKDAITWSAVEKAAPPIRNSGRSIGGWGSNW
jgi:hypothetical protein